MTEVGLAGRVAPSGGRNVINEDIVKDVVGPVPANGSLDVAFAIASVGVGDRASVQAPDLEAGLGMQVLGCTVAGTLNVRFLNPTAAPIEPASQTYQFTITKLLRTS